MVSPCTKIDERTIKYVMGWMERARMSSGVSGGTVGGGSFEAARVEMKIAPTPIGPKSTHNLVNIKRLRK